MQSIGPLRKLMRSELGGKAGPNSKSLRLPLDCWTKLLDLNHEIEKNLDRVQEQHTTQKTTHYALN